jgi:hypothetical protein
MDARADGERVMDAPAPAKVLVIACGAIAREVKAVVEANRLDHVSLRCLPATLHNHPERIADAVRASIVEARRDGFEDILVGYGDCGTGGGLDRLIAQEGATRLPGAHCYAFFSGAEAFARHAEEEFTAFYLTDFLARQFDAMVVRPLGLDRHPELRDVYFAHYDKLVYLAQSDDAGLAARARAAAERLGLAYEYRFTGYGDLNAALAALAKAPPVAIAYA